MNNLLKDIFGPFTDPATELTLQEKNNRILIEMFKDGEQKQYSLDQKTESIKSLSTNLNYPSINSLLASSEFADLKGMAATQIRMLTEIGNKPFLTPNFSSPGMPGVFHDNEKLSELLKAKSSSKTSIVLLDGPAGIGKTRFLQHLTFERATAFLNSAKTAPVLYIGSRGAKLSNLRAELASATQQLRASFTFDQVPVLVSRGLLDIAIDGFDELVDADGYHDAWHALQSFLSEIAGLGVCILAGRDTFFDQQGFSERLEASRGTIELTQLHLLLTEPRQALNWLKQHGWAEESLTEIETILQHNSYALRPYFLSVLAETPNWKEQDQSKTVRNFLVERFLDRETNLIQNMLGGETNPIRDALSRMFEDAAVDMAEREQGEVDIEYLGMLCELCFEGIYGSDEVRKLTHKAGSFGLLEPGASSRMRKFPHSEILNHFLARSILKDLHEEKIGLALRRGVLGADFVEVFQDVIISDRGKDLSTALTSFERKLSEDFSSDRLHVNGSAILLATLVKPLTIADRRLSNLHINECSLTGSLDKCSINNTEIYRLDARGADFSDVEFNNTRITMLIADELTRFGHNTPDISTIHLTDGHQITTLHSPTEINDWINQHRDAEEEEPYQDLVFFKFFEKICRRAIRQFYFRYGEHDPDPVSEFLIDEKWPHLAAILREHGRLDEVYKQVSGPPSVLYHVRDPQSLLSASDQSAQAVRNDVITTARDWELQ
ncbi:hypothetical protein [Pseudomonas soli]|uniref:hypothetical protein n=1 Tax=Pseudomonas soli TaxID=1306993 RepID=UPI0011B4338F|nr:hypothetical protein [Pseudomonas soli]